MIIYRGEMSNNNDNDKDQTIKQDYKITAPEKKKHDHIYIKGRPNIHEISKRNEEDEKRDRKSFYIVTGIIVLIIALLLIAVVLLVDSFS